MAKQQMIILSVGVVLLTGVVVGVINWKQQGENQWPQTEFEVGTKSEEIKSGGRDLQAEEREPIGGQTDEYGCLTGAGYVYSEEAGVCIRSWELDEEELEQVKLVMQEIEFQPGMAVNEVKKGECSGCYNVKLQLGAQVWLGEVIQGQVKDMLVVGM